MGTGVPLAGQQEGKSLASIGDGTGLVGDLAEDVGRVTEGSHRGGHSGQQSSGTGQGAQSSTAALKGTSADDPGRFGRDVSACIDRR